VGIAPTVSHALRLLSPSPRCIGEDTVLTDLSPRSYSTLNGGPVENRTPFIRVQTGGNTHYTTSPILAKVLRIELSSQGFGDLRIAIFPDQQISSPFNEKGARLVDTRADCSDRSLVVQRLDRDRSLRLLSAFRGRQIPLLANMVVPAELHRLRACDAYPALASRTSRAH
jgi:hypothetical protein